MLIRGIVVIKSARCKNISNMPGLICFLKMKFQRCFHLETLNFIIFGFSDSFHPVQNWFQFFHSVLTVGFPGILRQSE